MATRKTRAKKTASKNRASAESAMAEKRAYELTIVLSSTVKADQRAPVMDSLKKVVEKAQGTVERIDEIGLRDLAYPIRSERTGWYASLALSMPAGAVTGVDELVRRDEKIIRHLLIRAT